MYAKATIEQPDQGCARKRNAPLLLVLSALAVLVAVAFVPLIPRLVVQTFYTENTLLSRPIDPGEAFQIRFTHSVNRSDVTDTIEWTGRDLICRSTLFSAYGAGIPDLSDNIGTEFSLTPDGYLLSGINKVESEIPIMLQTIPNHRLLYRQEEINLLSLGGEGTIIVLRVQKRSLFSVLFSA